MASRDPQSRDDDEPEVTMPDKVPEASRRHDNVRPKEIRGNYRIWIVDTRALQRRLCILEATGVSDRLYWHLHLRILGK